MGKRSKIDINGLGSQEPSGKSVDTEKESAKEAFQSVQDVETAQAAPESDENRSDPRYEPPPRRPRSERKNAFNMGSWLLEGVLGVAEEIQHNDLGLPEEFWQHAYAARKETLLAVRALVDATLEQWEEEGNQREASSTRSSGTKKDSKSKQRGSVNVSFK